jgi:outer membrane protein
MFKKVLLLAVAGFAIMQPSIALAELKVGYFDFRRIIDNVPQAQVAEEKIRAEFAPKEKEISSRNLELKTVQEKLEKDAPLLNEEQLISRQRELRALDRELKLLVQEVKDDFALRKNQEMSKIQKSIIDAVREIGKNEAYDLILMSGAVYYGPKIDITAKILQRLSSN